MKRFGIFLLFVSLVAFGCKQRVVTQPEAQQPQEQKKEQKAEVTQPQKPSEKIPEQKVASADIGKETAVHMEEKEGMFKDVLFDFDKYDVKEEYKAELKALASWLLKNTQDRLSVEGHCDDRGTNEYNLALGDRRAKAVKDYLVSLGVPSARIDTLSYGEEKPLCSDQTEECWAKNRRAHFVVLKAGKK
jgi:peptidoglycan-associated lipoprotein